VNDETTNNLAPARKIGCAVVHASSRLTSGGSFESVNNMSIEITYNSAGGHEATASDGKYFCTCTGLSACGEAFFVDNFDSKIAEDHQFALRDVAFQRVKQEWDYVENKWSEPVDEADSKKESVKI
jgi:hypothetical protein